MTTKDTKHEEKPKHKDTSITIERDAYNFAVFSDGNYALAIDPVFKLNEKVGVIVEAFIVKGGSNKTKEELAAEVFAAIAAEVGEA